MTKVKPARIVSLILSFMLIIGLIAFTGSQPANAATVGSRLFTGTKNLNIASTPDGISLRPTVITVDEDNAVPFTRVYTTYAQKLYLGGYAGEDGTLPFSFNFTVRKTNFSQIKFTFASEDREKAIDPDRADLHVSDIKTELILKEDDLEDISGAYTITYTPANAANSAKGKFTLKKTGTSFEKFANVFADAAGVYKDPYRLEANLTIEFYGVDETFTPNSNEDEGAITENKDVATLLVTGINSQVLSSTGTNATDTSKPVLRFDMDKNPEYAVLDSTLTLPVYGLDVLATTTAPTIRLSVKYGAWEDYNATLEAEDQKDVSALTRSDLEAWFSKTEASGKYKTETYSSTNIIKLNKSYSSVKTYFYAVTVTARDGDTSNDNSAFAAEDLAVMRANDDTGILIGGEDSEQANLLIYKAVKRTSTANAFEFDSQRYKEKYREIENFQQGGTNNAVTFLKPELGDGSDKKDFRSLISGTPGQPDAIYEISADSFTYTLQYRTLTSTSYTDQAGLKFTARNEGPYVFRLKITDRLGRIVITDDFATLWFFDGGAPEFNFSSFTDTLYADQQSSLPYSVGTDDFVSSVTVTLKIFHVKDEDGEAVKKYKYVIETYTQEDLDEMDEDEREGLKVGQWKTDDSGSYVFAKDDDGEYVMEVVYDYLYDDDGNIQYEKDEDGSYKIDINTKRRIPIYDINTPARVEVTHSSGSFTPTEKGEYIAEYTISDGNSERDLKVTRKFTVEEAPEGEKPPLINIDWNPLTITSAAVGGASLLGIIVILLWPVFTKKKD